MLPAGSKKAHWTLIEGQDTIVKTKQHLFRGFSVTKAYKKPNAAKYKWKPDKIIFQEISSVY